MKKRGEAFNNKLLVFIITFTVFILYALIYGKDECHWDSHWYSHIADGVIDGEGIHLQLFPRTFRGCILPLYLQLITLSPMGLDVGWKLTASIICTILFVYIIPYIIYGNINKWAIIPSFIFIYMWGELIIQPLSDLIAFFFMATTVGLTISIYTMLKNNIFSISIISKSFMIGLCAYISYNTRVTYLYGIGIIAIVFIFAVIKEIKKRNISHVVLKKNILAIIISVLLGGGIIAIPQCIVNKNQEGNFSPRIYTENYGDGEYDVQIQQIVWGIGNQRYETYIGDDDQYPSPAVFFKNDSGNEIIKREGIDKHNFSIKKWFKLIIKYPFEMVSIYTGHLINAMTPLWRSIYIKDLYINKWFVVTVSLLIWIICATSIMVNIRNKGYCNELLFRRTIMISLIIPAILQIMGAVEVRFFLPVYMLAYTYVTMVDYRQLFMILKSKAITIVSIVVVVSMLWITVISGTLANNSEKILLINDSRIDLRIK